MSNIEFTPPAWEDYLYWQTANSKIFDRINSLIKNVVALRIPVPVNPNR